MPRESRLARVLQCVVFAELAAALAWAAWRWPHSHVQAVAGALFVLLLGPLVLAVEFALSARANRYDARVPLAAGRQLVSAWISESTHLYRAFAWRQPFRWRAVDDFVAAECEGRTGVVLVHGFMCNRGFWNPWMGLLRRQRRAFAAVNLEPVYGEIDAYPPLIEDAVSRVRQATGRPPLMVCHSMGGLAARAWWRDTAGAGDLAGVVTIGSPHGGTWMGRFSLHANGRQMRLGSAWLSALARSEESHPLPRTVCWYSNCDNMVFPAATAMLPRADNRFVPGSAHVALAFDARVQEGILALLDEMDEVGQGKSVTALAPENF